MNMSVQWLGWLPEKLSFIKLAANLNNNNKMTTCYGAENGSDFVSSFVTQFLFQGRID